MIHSCLLSKEDTDIVETIKLKRICSGFCSNQSHAACVVERHGQILKGPLVW